MCFCTQKYSVFVRVYTSEAEEQDIVYFLSTCVYAVTENYQSEIDVLWCPLNVIRFW